jgi:hypothetical protein
VKTRSPLAALLVFIALSVSAHAQTVLDPSFEAYNSDLSSPGSYTGEGSYPAGTTPGNPIPDWTLTSDQAGIQNGQTSGLYGGADSGLVGNDFAYDDGTAYFYQVLSGAGSTIEAGTYTLTVALGQRPDQPDAGGIISLANAADLSAPLATSGIVGATSDGAGTFTDYSIQLVVPTGSALLGDTLAIELAGANAKGQDGNPGNDDFDNVRLDFAAAPEPSTYAMMIGGALMLGLAMRRRIVRASTL